MEFILESQILISTTEGSLEPISLMRLDTFNIPNRTGIKFRFSFRIQTEQTLTFTLRFSNFVEIDFYYEENMGTFCPDSANKQQIASYITNKFEEFPTDFFQLELSIYSNMKLMYKKTLTSKKQLICIFGLPVTYSYKMTLIDKQRILNCIENIENDDFEDITNSSQFFNDEFYTQSEKDSAYNNVQNFSSSTSKEIFKKIGTWISDTSFAKFVTNVIESQKAALQNQTLPYKAFNFKSPIYLLGLKYSPISNEDFSNLEESSPNTDFIKRNLLNIIESNEISIKLVLNQFKLREIVSFLLNDDDFDDLNKKIKEDLLVRFSNFYNVHLIDKTLIITFEKAYVYTLITLKFKHMHPSIFVDFEVFHSASTKSSVNAKFISDCWARTLFIDAFARLSVFFNSKSNILTLQSLYTKCDFAKTFESALHENQTIIKENSILIWSEHIKSWILSEIDLSKSELLRFYNPIDNQVSLEIESFQVFSFTKKENKYTINFLLSEQMDKLNLILQTENQCKFLSKFLAKKSLIQNLPKINQENQTVSLESRSHSIDAPHINQITLSNFCADLQSCARFTYRDGFVPIKDTSIVSDSGWGCMHRTGQSMLFETFIRIFFGRGKNN